MCKRFAAEDALSLCKELGLGASAFHTLAVASASRHSVLTHARLSWTFDRTSWTLTRETASGGLWS